MRSFGGFGCCSSHLSVADVFWMVVFLSFSSELSLKAHSAIINLIERVLELDLSICDRPLSWLMQTLQLASISYGVGLVMKEIRSRTLVKTVRFAWNLFNQEGLELQQVSGCSVLERSIKGPSNTVIPHHLSTNSLTFLSIACLGFRR